MDDTIYVLTEIIRKNYPHLLDNDTIIVDYCFWDGIKNKELPVKKLDAVQVYKTLNNIKDLVLVIYFSDNTIGYRLKI